ncbi:hypothetical protein CRN42_24000 [Vibrio vulnificus]|nr:hypothetical protein CRN42_24000 [Vibrio vulnificus]
MVNYSTDRRDIILGIAIPIFMQFYPVFDMVALLHINMMFFLVLVSSVYCIRTVFFKYKYGCIINFRDAGNISFLFNFIVVVLRLYEPF